MKEEGRRKKKKDIKINSHSSPFTFHPSPLALDSNKIYLVQTDTTVGFLSQNREKLSIIKKRDPDKPFLISVDSFKELKNFSRVPKKYKNMVRRSKKTTFIYPNKNAVRVVKDENHLKFLKKFGWMYSTSANEAGKRFDRDFAFKTADVIVEDKRGFFESHASRLVKIGKRKMTVLR